MTRRPQSDGDGGPGGDDASAAAATGSKRKRHGVLRVAAAGDLHCTKSSQGKLQPIFAGVKERADVLVLCGDLTDLGHIDEAHVLAREIGSLGVPTIAVFGNHDYETGHQDEIAAVCAEAGIVVLDGEVHEVGGVSFAGIKGFAGGFGRHTLEPWGEPILKAFVQAAVDEALKLEKALSRVRGTPTVAILHYSPVLDTVVGEAPELYSLLGSSRLEEPIDRFDVVCAFHGHAHRGSLEGKTRQGVPVYNVAIPLLRRARPKQSPYRVVEVPLTPPPAD